MINGVRCYYDQWCKVLLGTHGCVTAHDGMAACNRSSLHVISFVPERDSISSHHSCLHNAIYSVCHCVSLPASIGAGAVWALMDSECV